MAEPISTGASIAGALPVVKDILGVIGGLFGLGGSTKKTQERSEPIFWPGQWSGYEQMLSTLLPIITGMPFGQEGMFPQPGFPDSPMDLGARQPPAATPSPALPPAPDVTTQPVGMEPAAEVDFEQRLIRAGVPPETARRITGSRMKPDFLRGLY